MGFHSIQEAKQSAETASHDAVSERLKELRPTIDAEVNERIKEEFATPKIDSLIDDAAKQATATTANKIIQSEVRDRVSEAVQSEQQTINNTLKAATERSVDELQNGIQKEIDDAVDKIVHQRIEPRLAEFDQIIDETSTYTAAREGDAQALDELVVISKNRSLPTNVSVKAYGDIHKVNQDFPKKIPWRGGCANAQQPMNEYISALQSDLDETVIVAIECIGLFHYSANSNAITYHTEAYPALDALFATMTKHPSLTVRLKAFRTWFEIVRAGKPGVQLSIDNPFDNDEHSDWWAIHRKDYLQ